MPSFLFCDSYIKDKRFRRLFESAFCPFTPKNPSQNKISSKNFLKNFKAALQHRQNA